MSKLKVEPKPVKSFTDLKPGDCIVGFSRRMIFQVKKAINEKLDDKYQEHTKDLKIDKIGKPYYFLQISNREKQKTRTS